MLVDVCARQHTSTVEGMRDKGMRDQVYATERERESEKVCVWEHGRGRERLIERKGEWEHMRVTGREGVNVCERERVTPREQERESERVNECNRQGDSQTQRDCTRRSEVETETERQRTGESCMSERCRVRDGERQGRVKGSTESETEWEQKRERKRKSARERQSARTSKRERKTWLMCQTEDSWKLATCMRTSPSQCFSAVFNFVNPLVLDTGTSRPSSCTTPVSLSYCINSILGTNL